jgi:hypothetical protein
MTFPGDFPEHSQSAVIAARVRAAALMEDQLSYLPSSPSKSRQLGNLGRFYGLQILAVFAKEACALGMERVWTTRQIDLAVLEFMRHLAIDVRSEYSHLGVPSIIGSLGSIDSAAIHELKSSDEWKAYQNSLLEVAEFQAKPAASIQDPKAKSAPKPLFPQRASWTRNRLRERGWDHNDPQRHSGPDRKTMQKILAAEAVKEESLEKLVISLNRKKINGVEIKLLEVPTD